MEYKPIILPDNPLSKIESIENGEYKRDVESFIQQIKGYIGSYEAKYSLTIGLEGDWGSGKSSLLNMLEHELVEGVIEVDKIPIVVRFNPWYYTDTSCLISQFFNSISEQISHKKNLSANIRKAARHIANAFGTLSEITANVHPLAGTLLNIGSKTLQFASQDTGDKSTSLEAQRDVIIKQLDKLTVPIIVLIDDLDRLQPQEIKQMLQAIRALGDLPKMIYVFAYDRSIVTKACTDSLKGIDGEMYLEKIIQIRMSVPTHREKHLRSYLEEVFDATIFKDEDVIKEDIDSVLIRLCDYVTNYRQIKQFLNRFFYRMQFYKKHMCIFDLFVLSILEVFFNDVVDLIKKCPPIKGDFKMNSNLHLLSLIGESHRKDIFVNEIKRLYPSGKDDESDDATIKQRNICRATMEINANFVRLLCLFLFDFSDNDLKPNVTHLRINSSKYIFRISEYISFMDYFACRELQTFNYQQYRTYLDRYNVNIEQILSDVKEPFLIEFLNTCNYRFEKTEIDNYIKLCAELAKHFPDKQEYDLYKAIRNLIIHIINNDTYKDKMIDALLNDETSVEYLIDVYQHLYYYKDHMKPEVIKQIDNTYGDRIIAQFNTNFIKQIDAVHNSLAYVSIFRFIIDERKSLNLGESFDTLIKHGVVCLDMLCYYADMLVDNIEPQKLKELLYKNIGKELLLKRINELKETPLYSDLEERKQRELQDFENFINSDNKSS